MDFLKTKNWSTLFEMSHDSLFLNENPSGSVLGLIPFHFATHSECDQSPHSWLIFLVSS
jgi:hypothetical protein